MRVPALTLGRLRLSGLTLLAVPLALGAGYLAAGGATPATIPPPATPTPGTSPSVAASDGPDATPSGSAQPATSPAAGRGTRTTALLAGRGDLLWRWVGDQSCPGPATGAVSRSTDGGGSWADVAHPGGVVVQLDAASASAAVVTVLDAACARRVLTTADGGVTWETLDDSGSIDKVSLGVRDGRWALRGGDVVREVDGVFTAPPAPPCVGTDVAAASYVVAVSAQQAFVLCQAADGGGRLLTRTADGGATWVRLAGKRAESGLLGGTRVDAVRFRDADRGVALLTSSRCPGGDLRTTSNAGALWSEAPCVVLPDKRAPQLLSVAAGPGASLRAVGRAGTALLLLRSPDGRTWTAAAL